VTLIYQLPPEVALKLEIFSADPAPVDLRELEGTERRLTIAHHGFVEPAELAAKFADLHFGLVSIDAAFSLPAFPSKAMAYLAAGLPILYTGRRLPMLEGTLRDNAIGVVLRDGLLSDDRIATFLACYPEARRRYLLSLEAEWDSLDRLL
jgi:hypothetical protein